MTPLYASAASALAVGLILYVAGLARPIWRSAALVMVAAFAGYFAYEKYGAKCCTACGETSEKTSPEKGK